MAGLFDDAVAAFGPFPEDARLKLAKELENAWGLSQNFGFDPAKAREHFQRIAVAAENLLGTLLIGPDDISKAALDERVELGTALGPLRTAYEASFVERRRAAGFKPAGFYPPGQSGQVHFEQAEQAIPLEHLIVAVADLATGAGKAAAFRAQRTQKGRLGSGRKELLMQRAFTIYERARIEHPDSGPTIAMGRPLTMFMLAVLSGAGFTGKDATQHVVKGAHQRWKQKHKPKRREALK